MIITDGEKTIIKEFKGMQIPSIYKFDQTANILFVEHVEFDICDLLLKGKKVEREIVGEEIKSYSEYLSEISVCAFDEYAARHFVLLNRVMNVFFKYNLYS